MAPDEAESDGRRAQPVAPREYAAFINQIELATIWLSSAQVTNQHGPDTPDKGVLDIQRSARWEARSGGFRTFHTYAATLKTADTLAASMEVTFGLDFESAQPMTEEIFSIFQVVNLPVNTWPYLREFLATTFGRFGWEPIIIPAFKVGAKALPRERRRQGEPARPHRRPREA
jgi:hypothetical protein